MKEFKKILFPVDLSESSPKIAPFVATMAQKFESEIHLVYVAPVFEWFSGGYRPHPAMGDVEGDIKEAAEKGLKEYVEANFKNLPNIKATIMSGDISEHILEYIESKGIDLLVMGTHGRRGMEKAIFGSVAERVAKASPVPVLLVNPHKVS